MVRSVHTGVDLSKNWRGATKILKGEQKLLITAEIICISQLYWICALAAPGAPPKSTPMSVHMINLPDISSKFEEDVLHGRATSATLD